MGRVGWFRALLATLLALLLAGCPHDNAHDPGTPPVSWAEPVPVDERLAKAIPLDDDGQLTPAETATEKDYGPRGQIVEPVAESRKDDPNMTNLQRVTSTAVAAVALACSCGCGIPHIPGTAPSDPTKAALNQAVQSPVPSANDIKTDLPPKDVDTLVTKAGELQKNAEAARTSNEVDALHFWAYILGALVPFMWIVAIGGPAAFPGLAVLSTPLRWLSFIPGCVALTLVLCAWVLPWLGWILIGTFGVLGAATLFILCREHGWNVVNIETWLRQEWSGAAAKAKQLETAVVADVRKI